MGGLVSSCAVSGRDRQDPWPSVRGTAGSDYTGAASN